MTPSVPGSNRVWFGISMVLVGLVVGYGVSVGIGDISIGGPAEPEDVFTTYAKELKLNKKDFNKCMESGKYTEMIKAQIDEGSAAGINGTPGNILVKNSTNEAIIVSGAQPIQNFKDALEALRGDELPEEITLAGDVTPVDPEADHIRGDKDAAFTIIEYSDFECPFCSRHHPTLKQLIEDEPDVNWVYRHFPLGFHASAQRAAEASECANEQGKFWEYTDMIYEKGV